MSSSTEQLCLPIRATGLPLLQSAGGLFYVWRYPVGICSTEQLRLCCQFVHVSGVCLYFIVKVYFIKWRATKRVAPKNNMGAGAWSYPEFFYINIERSTNKT